jgi:hypothetical protein
MTLRSILLAVIVAVAAPNLAIAQHVDKTQTLNSKSTLDRIKNFSQAKTGGGAIDGGGSDGLDMQSRPSAKGEIVIQVPGAVTGRYGYLRINGPPMAAMISRCRADSRGNLVWEGCFDHWNRAEGEAYSEKVDLNKTHKIIAGTYLIHFLDTAKFVTVREDKTTLVEVTTIHIPQTQEGIKFKVFRDYTNKSMQDLVHNETLYIRNMYSFSRSGSYCQELDENRFTKQLPFYKFTEEGAVSKITDCEGRGRFTYEYPARQYVGQYEGKHNDDSNSAYVLPGVYGIEFLNPNTGEVVTQYGFEAK